MRNKTKIIVLLCGLVGVFLCYVIYEQIAVNNILKSQYNISSYKMPSINKNGIIYLDKAIKTSIDLSLIPECLRLNEISHELVYLKPIKIIICEDDKASGKIFKLFKTKASGFAFSNDLIILNYNNLYTLGYNFESIIKHEFSHILIKQNIKSFITMILTFSNRSLWFSEGFALYNQGLVIFTQDELNSELSGYNIMYKSNSDNFYTSPRNLRIEYSTYYHFMKYIINKYGNEKIISYLKLMINDYKTSDKNFYKIFGVNIKTELEGFTHELLHKELI